ncbi:MAG: septal ring lytic transglycosylase RlpA family protein [Spirobacillus cienkowskii]|jgi:rare lipoprotein A|uniref:Probable endolytic peptidoglycan transglycosylase RlpA n=1 Tax=Spirobacillus cienkowskii TaxID=495820 RepID=A0A369KTW1_9BACT|nr:MAG: septal ring lytic transglycosylase RlpA family protein [Spirobacillus cienkowskii]
MNIIAQTLYSLILAIFFMSCTTTKESSLKYKIEKEFKYFTFYEKGYASFYDHKWAGRTTANGEKFNPELLTAASKTLPFNSTVMVKNTITGRSVFVRITDRGPYVKGRVIDLSAAAARKLGISRMGIAKVEVYLASN